PAGVLNQRLEWTGAGRAELAGVVAGFGREHADHPDVAAEGDRLDAVFGLAAPPRPDRPSEPDHVLGDLDPEQLGGDEVPDLVQGNRHQQSRSEREDSDDEQPVHQAPSPVISRARLRAQLSAARTSSTTETFPASCSSRTAATVSTIAVNGSRPARNAPTHSSFAAL